MFKPCIPHQAQAKRVHQGEKLHDQGALSKGKRLEGDLRGKVTTPFPGDKAVISIYGGPVPYESWQKLKRTSRVVNVVNLGTPEYLLWYESLVIFDRIDYPDCVLKPGQFPFIGYPLVRTTRLTKALMDGDSGLNLMHLDTFEGSGLGQDRLKTSLHPFYGVVLSKQTVPLIQISFPITFRDVSNYHTEMLTFKVVDFFRPYHIILGHPCYVKFIAIPSYAYHMLKIPGPTGIITMEAKAQRALDCE
jgi:hypothetical protein